MQENTRKAVLLMCCIIAAILIFSTLFIYLIKPANNEQEAIKIGYLSVAPDLSFFVALDQHYFEKQGLIIEPVKFESSNQIIDALVANKIDGTSIVALEALLSVEDKYPSEFKIFEMAAAEENSAVHKILVKKDSNINSLSDLEGKTIGTNPGSQMTAFLKLVLKNHADVSKINIVQLTPSLQTQALVSGQVDALFTLEPVGTIAESRGNVKVISVNPLYNELLKPFPTSASAFSEGFVTKNPKTVQKYILAIEGAHKFIESNEIEAKKSLSNYADINANITDKVGIYSYWSKNEIDVNAVNKLVDLYVSTGILINEVSIEKVILT